MSRFVNSNVIFPQLDRQLRLGLIKTIYLWAEKYDVTVKYLRDKGMHHYIQHFLYNTSCCIQYLRHILQDTGTFQIHTLFHILLQGLYHLKASSHINFMMLHLRTIFVNSWKRFWIIDFECQSTAEKDKISQQHFLLFDCHDHGKVRNIWNETYGFFLMI